MKLSYTNDQVFKIIQFTDLHYGEGDDRKDQKSTEFQEHLIDWEQPDLVVFSGDLISGYGWNGEQGWYEKQLNQVLSVVRKKQLPYAVLLGNHDTEADLNALQIMDLARKDEFSFTSTGLVGVHEERLDYLFPVYKENDTTINFYVAMLYSGRRGCQEISDSWGCFESYQIKWLESELLKIDENIPIYLFIHIPIPEYNEAWNQPSTNGSRYESPGTPKVNTGLVDLLVKSQNIITISCGHDHDNDFDSVYKGIRMVYGRKTGFGGYGPDFDFNRGARVFEIKTNPWEFETHIRSEGGLIEVQIRKGFETVTLVSFLVAFVISIIALVGLVKWCRCRRRKMNSMYRLVHDMES
ncbi:Metallo-dependent phosphatase-like protein [Globomyces pollinis-pini]|nr:Metallo-dependent phosphatase-like protein [Globomyces pollinis-pini]